MQVREKYFMLNGFDSDHDSRYLSYIDVQFPDGSVLLARAHTDRAELAADPERAKRMARERLIKDIMTQLQEKLFGA